MNLKNKKILIISPHLDDEVIGCGGMIEAAKRAKAEVFILYICSGEGRQLVTGKTTSAVRLKELTNLAKLGSFKYKVVFDGKEWLTLDHVPQKDIIDPIEDKIQEFKPDIILIPFKDSYNQDHRAVFTACISALRPVPQEVRHFVPTVLVYDEPYTWTTNEIFKPNFYLNISGFEEKKAEMMKCYASQDRKDPFPRSGDNLVRYARIRGAEIGVKAAEAYQLLRGTIQ